MRVIYAYVSSIVAGFALVALPSLHLRLLAPAFGGDPYLSTAVSSVLLFGLGIGIMAGAWRDLPDNGSTSGIATLFLASALWCIAAPWIAPYLAFGFRFGAFLASVVLLLPVVVLMAAALMLLLRLCISIQSEAPAWKPVASLLFLLPVGAILALLVIPWWGIPGLGISRSLFLNGALFLGISSWGYMIDRKRVTIASGIFFLLALFFTITNSASSALPSMPGGIVQYVAEAPAGEIRIIDTDAGRYCCLEGQLLASTDTSSWIITHPSDAVLGVPRNCFLKPGNVLIVGSALGVLADDYRKAGWYVDAVGGDAFSQSVGAAWFNLSRSGINFHDVPGRKFLRETPQQYDIIVLDAQKAGALSPALLTLESFEEAKKHLAGNGILAVNIEAIGWDNIFVRSVAYTLKQSFERVAALPTVEPPNRPGSVILLASNSPVTLYQELKRNDEFLPDYRYGPDYQRVHAWDNQFVPDRQYARLLTDDRNPTELWIARSNQELRTDLIKNFPQAALCWLR